MVVINIVLLQLNFNLEIVLKALFNQFFFPEELTDFTSVVVEVRKLKHLAFDTL